MTTDAPSAGTPRTDRVEFLVDDKRTGEVGLPIVRSKFAYQLEKSIIAQAARIAELERERDAYKALLLEAQAATNPEDPLQPPSKINLVIVQLKAAEQHRLLIEAQTIERCAKICDQNAYNRGYNCAEQIRALIQDTVRVERILLDAERWKALKELAGYWQDGSHTTVILDQDECTHMCFIKVGNKLYGTDNSSFDFAIDAARAKGKKK